MKKIYALLHLAFFVMIHFPKRLLNWKQDAVSDYKKSLGADNFQLYSEADKINIYKMSRCHACGLCDFVSQTNFFGSHSQQVLNFNRSAGPQTLPVSIAAEYTYLCPQKIL